MKMVTATALSLSKTMLWMLWKRQSDNSDPPKHMSQYRFEKDIPAIMWFATLCHGRLDSNEKILVSCSSGFLAGRLWNKNQIGRGFGHSWQVSVFPSKKMSLFRPIVVFLSFGRNNANKRPWGALGYYWALEEEWTSGSTKVKKSSKTNMQANF